MVPLGARSHRLRLSLGEGMALVALAALLCRWPGQMMPAVPTLLAYLFATRRGGAPHRRAWPRLGVLLTAVNAPCVPGLFSDCDHCRLTWLRLFPVVPGVGPGAWIVHLLGFGRLPDWAGLGLAAVVSCGIIGALAIVSRRGPSWLMAATIIGFAWSSVWAGALYAAVRA